MHQSNRYSSLAPAMAAACAAVLLFAECNTDRKRGEYVARVENVILTEDDLTQARDSSGEVQAFSKEYINEWITGELLFQEAERRGLTESEEFQRRVRETSKRMAVAALLQKELYDNIDTNSVTESSLQSFFSASSKDFTLHQDLVLASLTVFDDRDAANMFRSRVLRGTPWATALQQLLADSAQKAHLLRVADQQYFTRTTLFPEELWKLARSLEREDVSFPLKTQQGTFVIRVHQTYRQGEVPPFNYARNEVRQRLMMDLRRKKYDNLVTSLRAKRRVDVRFSSRDTTTTPPTE